MQSLVEFPNPLNGTAQLTYLRYDEICDLPPIEWFDEIDTARGHELLVQLGVSGENAWYVCFFARDNAYSEAHFSGKALEHYKKYHECRNSNIDTYVKAMKFVLDRGGHVIRMGSIVEKIIGYQHPRLIDYPFSTLGSDFADVFLVCHCKFIIGDCSGVVDLSSIVDMPYGRVNEPLYSIKWGRANRIFIPKLIRHQSSGKCLTLDEFGTLYNETYEIGSSSPYHFQDLMKQRGFAYEDNSEDDILMVTEAMYEKYVEQVQHSKERYTDDDSGSASPREIWPPFLQRHPELLGKAQD